MMNNVILSPLGTKSLGYDGQMLPLRLRSGLKASFSMTIPQIYCDGLLPCQGQDFGRHREAFWRRSSLYRSRSMRLPPIRLRSGQAHSTAPSTLLGTCLRAGFLAMTISTKSNLTKHYTKKRGGASESAAPAGTACCVRAEVNVSFCPCPRPCLYLCFCLCPYPCPVRRLAVFLMGRPRTASPIRP